MKQKLRLIIAAAILFATPLALSINPAYASCGSSSSSKGQVLQGVGETGSNCSGSGVTDAVTTAVNILSWVVGVAAVIMIVVAGFRYITSGGDSGRVGSAKNTLIYALIGVAVAALAQLLVSFVIKSAK